MSLHRPLRAGLATTAVVLVAGLLGAPATAAPAAVPTAVPTAAAPRTTFRIASYNVHKNDHQMPWTARRRNLVVGQILAARADVVALQEVHGEKNFPSIYRQVKSRYTSNAACGRVKRTNQYDARARILWDRTRFSGSREISGRLRLDNAYGPSNDFGCYQLLTERRTGVKVLVASVHLATGTGARLDARRLRQTRNLIAQVAAVKKAHRASWPVIYAGDYNSSASKRYTFDAPRRAMRAVASRDAYAVAKRRVKGSYNSANRLRPKPWRTHHHIDHVYVSPGVGVSRFRVVVRLKGKRYRVPFASDHNPIVATVSVPRV